MPYSHRMKESVLRKVLPPNNRNIREVAQETGITEKTIYNRKKMAELFDVKRPAVTRHMKNIFESGELDEQVVSSILEHTTGTRMKLISHGWLNHA